MNIKNNRRTIMTRKILKDTMMDLLQTNSFAEISIKKLCEEADVNRSTFYAYYENQSQVIAEIQEETFQALKDILDEVLIQNSEDMNFQIFLKTLTYVKNEPKRFYALTSAYNGNPLREILISLAKRDTDSIQSQSTWIPKGVEEYVFAYRIAGYTEVVKKWLQEGAREPIENISSLLVKLSARDKH